MMGRTVIEPRGPGEAANASKRRTLWIIIGVLFASGFVLGLSGALFENETDGGWMTGTLPPWFALVAALGTAFALIVGSWVFYARIDELERQDNLMAGAVGANLMMIGYPLWFILWKGGWVIEPQHEVLFVTLFVTTMATYLYRKFR